MTISQILLHVSMRDDCGALNLVVHQYSGNWELAYPVLA